MAHIYKILNVATDDFYIGSSVNFKKRKWEHLNMLKKNMHHCEKLQAAWNEYGPDAFEFELLEEVPDEDALRIEDTYLAQHAGTAACYNTAFTSMQSPSETRAETRAKISDTLTVLYKQGHAPRAGKFHSEATKERISLAKLANPSRHWLGKPRSAETKQKISAAQKGIPKAPRTYTEEGLAKAREVMKQNSREQHPADFAEVMAKFPSDVLTKYDFSLAVYTGALIRIQGCKCPKHGVFSQYAAQLRKGRGCPECGAEQRAQSKRKQMLSAWATKEGRDTFMENRLLSTNQRVIKWHT
jgi:group I intron endonuclease